MKQQHYFIVVLAHSFHGRLRRLHIPHHAVYGVLLLALLGAVSVFGMVSSYARMAWKVANYNSLQSQFDVLRQRYQNLQRSANQTNEQLATLQMFASEVSMAFGVTKRGQSEPAFTESNLLPSFNESLQQFDFLKSATFARNFRKYPKLWQSNVRPTLWPVFGRLVSTFGRRVDPFSGEGGAFHSGVDLSAGLGTPVKATADGVVSHAAFSGAYGRLVVIDHGGGMQTYYAHLSRFDVVPGQEIRRGQILGASGSTGRSTGAHLHYEVRQNGTPVNPYTFLSRAETSSGEKRPELPF